MAKLDPVVVPFRADMRHVVEVCDIVIRHLTALRDELVAHDAPDDVPRQQAT
jgi:hypothetical protein